MYERTYSSRVLNTEEKKHRKGGRQIPWRKIWITLGTIAVFTGLVVFIRAPRFQVKEVNVVGTNVADPIEVSQFVLGKLQGNFVRVLPRSSILLISPDKLTKEVAAAFPRFKSVKVDRDSFSSLRVDVAEYGGMYLWCDTEDTCSFMDETGTVFADAPYFSGSAYTKIVSGARQEYPFAPITAEQLALVGHLKEKLAAIEIVPLSFAFESDHKLVVAFIHHSNRAVILFNPNEDADVMLGTLYSGLRTNPVSALYHNESKVLEYLDVRFANKLIYKFN